MIDLSSDIGRYLSATRELFAPQPVDIHLERVVQRAAALMAPQLDIIVQAITFRSDRLENGFVHIGGRDYIYIDLNYLEFLLCCDAALRASDPKRAARAVLVKFSGGILRDYNFCRSLEDAYGDIKKGDYAILSAATKKIGGEYLARYFNICVLYLFAHEAMHCAVARKTSFSIKFLAAEMRSSRDRLQAHLEAEHRIGRHSPIVLKRWKGSAENFKEKRINIIEQYRDLLLKNPKYLEEIACDSVARAAVLNNFKPASWFQEHAAVTCYLIHLHQSFLFQIRAIIEVAVGRNDPFESEEFLTHAGRLRIAGDDLKFFAVRFGLKRVPDKLIWALETQMAAFEHGALNWFRRAVVPVNSTAVSYD